MIRPRATCVLAATMFVLVLAGCTESAPAPFASSAPPTPAVEVAPSEAVGSLAYDEVPINCLNVLSGELRAAILDLDDVRAVWVRGLSGVDADGSQGWPEALRRVSCDFATPEADPRTGVVTVTMTEFDETETDAVVANLLADVRGLNDIEVVEPAPGFDVGVQVRQSSPGGSWVRTVLPGRSFEVGGGPVIERVAADLPDAAFDAEAFMAAAGPVGQGCDVMLPPGQRNGTDASGTQWVLTDDFELGNEPLRCMGWVARDLTNPALRWESVDAATREMLLADAEAGAGGAAIEGTTSDGSGAVLTTSDGIVVVFDDSLVRLTLPVDTATALEIAQHIHAPAWLDEPALS